MLSALGIEDGVILEDLDTFAVEDGLDWEASILSQDKTDLQINEVDDIESVEHVPTTWNEAKLAMNTLSDYCSRDSDLLDSFGKFKNILIRYQQQNVKQTKISSFFQ